MDLTGENRATLLATGTEIGGYRVESVLGRGGMGVVYEAMQLSLSRTVALKLLAGDLAEDGGFRDRFRREARLQAAIEHDHIVSVYEAGEFDGGLFIAMRLVRGTDLKRLVRSGELTPERAIPILLSVADALDTAHESGLIHRDVKPQNILVGRRDHAYLADFGLTKGASDTGYTRTGQLMGTLDYVSPEQIGGGDAGRASDIYALAAVAFECLCGRAPFARPTEAAVLYAHMAEPPPAASAERPELPGAVDAVLARGLAKAPAERQATAVELVGELRDALAGAAVPAPAPVPLPPPPEADATEVRDAPGSPTIADRRRPGAAPPEPAARRGRLRRRAGRPAPPAEEAAEPVALPPAPETTERIVRPPAPEPAVEATEPIERTPPPEPAVEATEPIERTPAPRARARRRADGADGTGAGPRAARPRARPGATAPAGARSPPRWPWPAARSCSPGATRSAARAARIPPLPPRRPPTGPSRRRTWASTSRAPGASSTRRRRCPACRSSARPRPRRRAGPAPSASA